MRISSAFGTVVLIPALCLCAPGQNTQSKDPQASEAKGIPPRAAPADYQAQAPAGTVTVGAEFIGHSIPTPGGSAYRARVYVGGRDTARGRRGDPSSAVQRVSGGRDREAASRRPPIHSRIVTYGTAHLPQFHLPGLGGPAQRVERVARGDGIPGLGVGVPRVSRRFRPTRPGQLPAQRRALGSVCADRQRPLRVGVRWRRLSQASVGGISETLDQRDLVRIPASAPVWEAHPYSGARADLGPAERVSGGAEDRDGSERRGAFRGVVRLPGFRLQAGKSQLDSSLPRLGRSQADSVRLAAPGGSAEPPPVRTTLPT